MPFEPEESLRQSQARVLLQALRWIILAFAGLGFLIGAVFVAFGMVIGNRASESVNWPTTTGRVVASRMHQKSEIDPTTDTPIKPREFATRKRRTVYRPIVEYRYEVEGSAYSAHVISFEPSETTNAARARAVLQRYPIGAEVTVSYSPHDPTIAVLEPGPSKNARGSLAFGVGFMCLMLLLGGACSWWLSRLIAKQRDSTTRNRPKIKKPGSSRSQGG